MRIIVSADGYSVTGDRPLKWFGLGVAALDTEVDGEKPWVILLNNKERVVDVLSDKDKTKPRISMFHDRVYIVVEGIGERFHYIYDLDDFDSMKIQIVKRGGILFGVVDATGERVERILDFPIII